MKTLISLLFAAIALASFAEISLHAQSQRGDYARAASSNLHQHAPVIQRTGPIYSVPFYPLSGASLAPGENRELVESYCGTCHSTIYITMQPPLPAATWGAEVNKMVRTFGQPIPPDAIAKIIAYLQAHYTPETRSKHLPAAHSPSARHATVPKTRKPLVVRQNSIRVENGAMLSLHSETPDQNSTKIALNSAKISLWAGTSVRTCGVRI
jgi:hypothetical protein